MRKLFVLKYYSQASYSCVAGVDWGDADYNSLQKSLTRNQKI